MKFGFLATLAALSFLSACSKSGPESAMQAPQSAATATTTTATPTPGASGTLGSLLGFEAELASERPVSDLQGDFNGDGVKDRLLVVKSASLPTDTPANVTVVRPWRLHDGESVGGLSHGAAVNLAIVDGKASHVTILHDDNSTSMLDVPQPIELEVMPQAKIASLEEPELAQTAVGDLLVLPTPAGIDTYIYWDGSSYKLFEPLEAP